MLAGGAVLAAPVASATPAEATVVTPAAAGGEIGTLASNCNRTLNQYRGSYIAKVPASSTSYDCIMAQGAQGEHVRALQLALSICHGYTTGGIDGIYGPATRNAVMALQRASGIAADGVYGPQTRTKVKWRFYSNSGAMCAS